MFQWNSIDIFARRAYKKFTRLIGLGQRISLPNEIIEEIIDFVVLIPGTVDAFSRSPFLEMRKITTCDEIRQLIVDSRKTCFSIALVNRAFYKMVSRRIYWMMLHIPSGSLKDRYICDPMILKRITGHETNGALVTRFDMHIDYNLRETALSACECLRQCVNIKHFLVNIRLSDDQDTELILETAASTFGENLRTFECYLSYFETDILLKYVSRMPNLAVLRITNTIESIHPSHAGAPRKELSLPSHSFNLTFLHLHTLRIHRMQSLPVYDSWNMPNLARFRVDEERSYDIPKMLTPVLHKARETLSVLELRYVGPFLSHVLQENPFLTEAVFDLRGEQVLDDAVLPGTYIHSHIRSLGIRGFTRRPFLMDIPQECLPSMLKFILTNCEFSALSKIFLMDFTVEVFREFQMRRDVGRTWLKVIRQCRELKLDLQDRDNILLEEDHLPMWVQELPI